MLASSGEYRPDVPVLFRSSAFSPSWLHSRGALARGHQVIYRDVKYAIPFVVPALALRLAGRLFDRARAAQLRALFALNPMTGVIDGSAGQLLGGSAAGHHHRDLRRRDAGDPGGGTRVLSPR